MANFAIQYLKHGKALCGKAFNNFVETFNWHNSFCKNLKGDGDLSAACGKIHLDRSKPDFPVIRCSGCDYVPEPGDDDAYETEGCFRLVKSVTEPESEDDEPETVFSLADCYYSVGGILRHAEDIDVTGLIDGAAEGDVLFVNLVESSVTAGVADFQGLEEMQKDASSYVFALYVLSGADGSVLTDLRNAPQLQLVEPMLDDGEGDD